MDYLIYILFLISVYSLLGVSLNLSLGYTGMVSLAHAFFFGLGAYTAARTSDLLAAELLSCLAAAAILSAIAAAALLSPMRRLRDDYFILGTFSVQVVGFHLFNNLDKLTGGPRGITGIERPWLFVFSNSRLGDGAMLSISVVILVLALLYLRRIERSVIGLGLRMIREDERLAESAGQSVQAQKLLVFSLSASIAGVAGGLYAFYVQFIDPQSFRLMESVFLITIVVLGGAGRYWTPIVGATLLVVFGEGLRLIDFPDAYVGNFREIVYGVLLVVLVTLRPQGLLGRVTFIDNRGSVA